LGEGEKGHDASQYYHDLVSWQSLSISAQCLKVLHDSSQLLLTAVTRWGVIAWVSARGCEVTRKETWRGHAAHFDVNLGYVRVRDPDTGQEFVTAAGKHYDYRRLVRDRPFGTDLTDRPNIDAIELHIVR
jgi:hypothetical protein